MEKQSELEEFLDLDVEGEKLKDISAKKFCLFVLKKLNSTMAYDKEVRELLTLVNYWKEPTMGDDLKIDIIRKLRALKLL